MHWDLCLEWRNRLPTRDVVILNTISVLLKGEDFYFSRKHKIWRLTNCRVCGEIVAPKQFLNVGTKYAVCFHWGLKSWSLWERFWGKNIFGIYFFRVCFSKSIFENTTVTLFKKINSQMACTKRNSVVNKQILIIKRKL